MTADVLAAGRGGCDLIEQEFSGWLHRPFLDLSEPDAAASFVCRSLKLDFEAVESGESRHKARGWNPPSFRRELRDMTGLAAYDVTDPAAVPRELRSDRWQMVCEQVAVFPSLAARAQERVAWLLLRLGFHELTISLVPEQPDATLSVSADSAALAYLRAFARYGQWLNEECPGYSLGEFERIARLAPRGRARLDALYHLVEQNAKFRGDAQSCEHWQGEHLRELYAYRDTADDITYQAALSRYHRVGGFIPQLKRDKDGVASEMTAAEEVAHGVPRDTFAGLVLSDSSLIPVIESRLREALWIGDLDAAETRAEEGICIAPASASSWMRRGEVSWRRGETARALDAYRRSALLAPPGVSYCLFMAGQCHEELGDPQSACDAYLGSLRADPWSISAAECLRAVAGQRGVPALAHWADSRLAKLSRIAEAVPARHPHPYQSILPPNSQPADTVSATATG